MPDWPVSTAAAIARRCHGAWVVFGIAFAALIALPVQAHAQFELGLQDSALQQPTPGPAASAAYAAMRATNSTTIRVTVWWYSVAPNSKTKPNDFDGADPADRQYQWGAIDAAVRVAAQHGDQVLLVLLGAPRWAEGQNPPQDVTVHAGAWEPNARAFADFARAAALRYSGTFPDPLHPGGTLPRVKRWEIWNEENLPFYLAGPHVVDEYRSLLNAGYSSIKGVAADNVVVLGGLAPVSFLPPRSVSPLKFAAQLLCLQRVGTRFIHSRSCTVRAHFDVFAHHPYTLAATPTKPAYRYDDVLIGDMGKIRRLVQAADRLHTVAPAIHHRVWVTEWAWITNPPNHVVGDSDLIAARYVAYSMYQMWRSGVQLVVWQTIRDFPQGEQVGGGLYWSSGRPKDVLSAFAFPVIASVTHGHGFVWGRAPVSGRTVVVVERASGKRWERIATARTGFDGIFRVKFTASRNGRYRARVLHGATSLAYDSTPIPPRRTHLFNTG